MIQRGAGTTASPIQAADKWGTGNRYQPGPVQAEDMQSASPAVWSGVVKLLFTDHNHLIHIKAADYCVD